MSKTSTNVRHTIPEEMLEIAKEKMIKLLDKNLHLRCNKIIQLLNKTTKNNAKTCILLKQFALNAGVTKQILQNISAQLTEWKGGNYCKQLQTNDECFKKIRAHWNRQKSQQLGNQLFVVVLFNLFKIIIEIKELSQQEQLAYYIDLFYELLKEKIQFDQSMARPVLPIACFDKANKFRCYCENILESFGGNIKWNKIKSTQSVKGSNGITMTKYIKNANRAQILADSYYSCLQDTKAHILQKSNEFIQHSIQGHLQWINRTFHDNSLTLIEWLPIQPVIAFPSININNDNNSFPDSVSMSATSIIPNNPIITEQMNASATATFSDHSEHFYSNHLQTNSEYIQIPPLPNTSSNYIGNPFINTNQNQNFVAPNMETHHECCYQTQCPMTYYSNTDINNNICPLFTPTNTNNMYHHNAQNQYTINEQNGCQSHRQFQSNGNFLNPSNRTHMINTRHYRNISSRRRESYFDSIGQSVQQRNYFPQ